MTGTQPAAAERPPEGLDWLGRAPNARVGISFRLLIRLFRLVVLRVCGLRLTVEGLDNLPPGGGHILAIASHRSWIDAPLVVAALPVQPRVWYLASGAATFRYPFLERLMRRVGGMLPVHRGGVDLAVHIAAAHATLDAGAVYGVFPEGTRNGPPLAIGRFRRGIGLVALRTGVPVVPVVLAGTRELYRGRRIFLRVLPPVSAPALIGCTSAPAPDTPAEIDAARAVTERLRELLAPHVSRLASLAEDPPDRPRPWRGLTTLFGSPPASDTAASAGAEPRAEEDENSPNR